MNLMPLKGPPWLAIRSAPKLLCEWSERPRQALIITSASVEKCSMAWKRTSKQPAAAMVGVSSGATELAAPAMDER